MVQTYSTDKLHSIIARNKKKKKQAEHVLMKTGVYCIHCNRIQVTIYGATFMSKMIILPELYPKHTLSPEIDDEVKLR